MDPKLFLALYTVLGIGAVLALHWFAERRWKRRGRDVK
jgi:hypothetical protein